METQWIWSPDSEGGSARIEKNEIRQNLIASQSQNDIN